MGPEGIRTGIPVNDCLHFRIRLNPDINQNPARQVTFSSPGNVLGKAGNFRLAVKLRRYRDVHPRKVTVVVLSLGGHPTQVREEVLNLALEVSEVIVIG